MILNFPLVFCAMVEWQIVVEPLMLADCWCKLYVTKIFFSDFQNVFLDLMLIFGFLIIVFRFGKLLKHDFPEIWQFALFFRFQKYIFFVLENMLGLSLIGFHNFYMPCIPS